VYQFHHARAGLPSLPAAGTVAGSRPGSASHARALSLYGHGLMAATPERQPGVIITHPNRDKPVVQATRATVILLLVASAALVLIVTVGGWPVLESAKPVDIGYIVVY